MRTPMDSIDQLNGSAVASSSRFAAGLILGALAGAAVALLFAPTTGQKLRKQLYDGAGTLANKARDAYSGASSAVSDVVNEATSAARSAAKRATVNS